MNFTRSESAHYYFLNGKPCFEVDGKKTTIRECRKLGLLPSVTTILKLYPSFGLRNWLNGQLVMSAHTTPRLADDTDEQWKDRVLADADEEANIGREIGTLRHEIIESFHITGIIDEDSTDYHSVDPYVKWYKANIKTRIYAEQIVVNTALGYAGTLDLHANTVDGRQIILDLKNRRKVTLYDTDVLQLAAYQHCLRPRPDCISVVLGTAKPDILVREWNPLQMREAWETFKLLLQLWKQINNYESRIHNLQIKAQGRKSLITL